MTHILTAMPPVLQADGGDGGDGGDGDDDGNMGPFAKIAIGLVENTFVLTSDLGE